MLMDKSDILKRWSEYIEELFSDTRKENLVIKKNMDGPSISKEEVKAAIKKMKSGTYLESFCKSGQFHLSGHCSFLKYSFL